MDNTYCTISGRFTWAIPIVSIKRDNMDNTCIALYQGDLHGLYLSSQSGEKHGQYLLRYIRGIYMGYTHKIIILQNGKR